MNFPKELAALPQWICWRLEPDSKSEKPRKVPYDPKTGRKASSTNPQTWATLAEAKAARQKYLFTGVGFVFTEAGGIIGVDIDHCRNENGEFNETAKSILAKYPSYTEISPSGTGLHIFYRGSMPGKGNKNSQSAVEMYAAARYFTMTGNRLDGTPEDIADGSEALPWIHETYVAKKKAAKSKAKRAVRTVSLTDEQVLEKAASAQNGEDFTALWEGRWQEKFGSQSEADLALCCALAFWTGRNKEQMDRLFRQSKLFREKWDNVHHADGATYGEETLAQAIARTENVYTPGGDLGIFEANGRYMRERGENVYALTNFVVRPLEMLVAEDETQMTCDLVTMYGETFRLSFMTSDFASAQKFKAVLNKRTISLCYMGSDGDLEVLKSYLAALAWQVKHGVKALGLYEHDGRWAYVDKERAFAAGGEDVADMVQLEKYASIETELSTPRGHLGGTTDRAWPAAAWLQRACKNGDGAGMVHGMLRQGNAALYGHQISAPVPDRRGGQRQVHHAGAGDPAPVWTEQGRGRAADHGLYADEGRILQQPVPAGVGRIQALEDRQDPARRSVQPFPRQLRRTRGRARAGRPDAGILHAAGSAGGGR